MGHPKKPKKKYSKPSHPWEKERIEEEKALMIEYGFKNKREMWKVKSMLKKFLEQAKRLSALRTEQAEKEKELLLKKLKRLGILNEKANLNDILNLTFKDIAERRLQTLVFRKGLARSVKQARQFIVHRHIVVDGKKITSPSYIVPVSEEDKISFSPKSPLSSEDHPERKVIQGEK